MFISALKEPGLENLAKKEQECAEKGGVLKKPAQAASPEVMADPGMQGGDDVDAPEVTEILKTDAMKKKYHSKKAKLTEKGLQKLDDEIKSDQHLRLVAEKLNKWEKKADLLDLSQRDVSDLKDQYGGNPCNYRTQALLEWKDKALEPSYHCLLCICIAAEWTESADVIIELLEKGDEDLLETKELKQRYAKYLKKIPAEKRPKLESKISNEEHLRQVSSKLTKWEEKPDLLEIERTEVQDIRDRGDPAMERRGALDLWRNRAVSPTYHRLLRICIAGTWKDAADEIIQVLTS